ncbi:Rrf2 family transcriptional regulator [Pseudonocardia kujensis]|uniref:Rrf2 family transcriptional regulator n=1 Tax=Pseudonocardia kujensis TaxID=1128675 RepID=UPI001E2B6B45|nr:Rrf2 family transcriptional regulator [Pseudonocardia kujensis]MCE0763662.1 Rrf2 family transcriptional regulator [Pseudonocardia kujensis]
MTTAAPAPTVFTPAAAVRGTVVVLVGRGENPGVYARFGTRLAFDGYTVVVPHADATDAEVTAALVEGEGARVLLGSDAGALRAWSIAAQNAPDALVLAALPLGDGDAPADHDAEIAARTACPVHRQVLDADPDFRWGELTGDLPEHPGALPDVPTLVLHGEADPIAPVEAVRALTAEVAVVRDGVHDVLNDQFHRIVAARIVTFLEGVAKGAGFVEAAVRETTSRKAAPLHVSARLDYALRAIAELIVADAGPVRCEQIARSRAIPLNSLVNIMIQLRKAGLVSSRRGCEGGYRLARDAAEITLADVVRATEGAIATVPAGAPWGDLERTVREYLEERSVLELTTGSNHA